MSNFAVRHVLPALAALAAAAAPLAAQDKQQQPLDINSFEAVKAVSDPQMAPNGSAVLYAVRTASLGTNSRSSLTYKVAASGGIATAYPDASTSASQARWSPDGKRVAYIAGGQLWVADQTGGARKQLTTLAGGATGPIWSPSGDRIAFTSRVYPSCSEDACNAARQKAADSNPVKAHIADELMYRHWNAWDDGTRAHLFVVGADGNGLLDLTPGATYDVPPGPFGGSEGYAWAPDGRELAYTAKDAGREDAWSTDNNLYTVPAAGGKSAVITGANKGADENPVYSPDGKFILYHSQARAGFESDRWRLMAYDRSSHQSRELLPQWDRNADSYVFAADGHAILIQTVDASREKFYRSTFSNGNASAPQLVLSERNNGSLSLDRAGRTMAWVQDAADRPAEVFVATLGAGVSGLHQLSHENDALLTTLKLYPVEDYWFKGANGDSVQGMILRPPQWTQGKKFPVVLLIHGGPQVPWLDQWHGRWNYQMFAAPGYGLVIINPRGSPGYGQKFVDAISRDWGGAVYSDLMLGLDAALAKDPWLDSTRMGAAGGSYGGYMVDWIAGHSDRFKALVSHAGPYNLENMYGATEELWFPAWEYGGPYWDSTAMAQQYRKWSPHLYAKNFKTPTLVTAGELDYRVPYTEDLSFFSALQRQGVQSRLVVFPDEGHWIQKPQNQKLWWSEVQGWLGKYLQSPAM
ncbi:MAG TPA: S9 family peptidase [Gemmatimonadaceae bacterium]|nr:S9 family peptidase [Gemmatimonadaceae bacterium]